MVEKDFRHLTNDELINGIQAANLPDYIRSKAYGIDVRETLAQMTEMTIQLGVNMGLSPDAALSWGRRILSNSAQLEQKTDKGNVSVRDINKNLGKFDQTYMTDEFIQQMAGNTPVNSIPADGSINIEKLTPQLQSMFITEGSAW